MANQESRLAIVIDTAQAERNAKRLREALKGISLDGSRTGSALGDLGGQSVAASSKVDKLNASTKELGSTLGRLKGIVAGAFAGIGIRSLLSTADTMQSLDSQVRLVTDSVAQFNAVQDRLGKIANNQYADIEALTTLYTRSQRALSQLGKSQNEVLQFTENVSMAMRVGGVSAQEQAAALLQLSQALGSGVLRGDEFNSIAEQAPILLRLVSEEMGVTQGALRELAADGKITSEIVYNAVANATESLTDMASKMPVTVGQALTVLSNNYKKFVGDFINSTTGLSSIVAGAIGVIAQNFDTLSTILLAGAAVWAYYALASSSFVVSTIPALVLGIQTSIMGFLSQTAAIQAAILAQGQVIASTFSLASMQGYLTATTYTLQQARVVATLALLNYKLALFEAVAAMQAKIASTAGAIAVQAQYAYSVATSGNLLAIFGLAVKGAATSLVAKVSATAAAARANAIYAASMVAIHGPIGAANLGIRALTGAIIAKTGAMIAAVRQTSAYSLAMGGLGLAAKGATTAVSGVAAMFGRLAAVLLAHPILAIAGTIFAVTASTRGMKGAIDDVTDAFYVLGYMAADAVRDIIEITKAVWNVTTGWFKSLMGGGSEITGFLASVFGGWFEGTRGGFVGLLQVIARVFDSIAKVGLTVCLTLDKGFRNLGIALENIAKGIANAFIDAFNWVSRGVTNMTNFVKRQANNVIDGLNKLPFVNIGIRLDDSEVATQLDHFSGSSYIPNSISGNYQQASTAVFLGGFEARLEKSLYKRDYERLRSTQELTDGLLDQTSAFEALGGTAEKAGAKGKKATDKMAKGAKGAAEKLSDAQKAAKALNDAFLKAQQSLQRTLNLVGQETNLAQWIYDLSDPLHELYNLSDNGKAVLKELAASIDISELSYELGKSNKELEHQIKLLDAKSDLKRELMGIEKETGQLLEKYEIYKNTPGFEHVYKEIEAEAQLNEQLKKNLALLKEEQELKNSLDSDLSGIRTELLGYGINETDHDKNDYQLADTLERLRQAHEMQLMQQDEFQKLSEIAKQRHADKMAEIENAMYQNRAGLFASASKALLGENSRTYKLMFAIEKGYALQSAWLKSKKAVLDAYADTPGSVWNKAWAAAKAAADTGLMAAAISAVQAPIGQAHDGIMSVPKSGTWNLEKGERVLPAHTAKAMDKKLEASNDAPNVNITVNVDANGNAQMDAKQADNMSRSMANSIKAVVVDTLRKEKRQGGMLSA